MQTYKVKTPNFIYALDAIEKKTPFHTIDFSVGKEPNVCLTASIFLPDIDKRFIDLIDTCTLHTIDALEECTIKWEEEKSFGTELLYSFISILSANYPHVTRIKLHDASYIPCKPYKLDTLDLITYSIALYGKTWYEQKAGAHLFSNKYQLQYDTDIATYKHPATKAKLPFLDMYKHMIINTYTRDVIGSNIKIYETMYDTSDTFPIFFKKISKDILEENKCKFFKDWLESFVSEYIHIQREWLIPLKLNETLTSVLNVSSAKPMNLKKRNRTSKNR